MAPEIPIGLALIATGVTTLVGVLGIAKGLKKAQKAFAVEAAAEVIRGEIGKKERERDIQAHALTCQFPGSAHRELMEVTERIERAVVHQTDRIERLTDVVIGLSRNNKTT